MGNFEFLSVHSKALAALGATAEKIFPLDPTSCVFKLRLLAEAITQDVAARLGIQMQQPTQLELLRTADQRLGLDFQVRQMFQLQRVRGNEAAHQVAPSMGYREIVRRVETLFAFADRLESRLQAAQTAAKLLRRLRESRAAEGAAKPKRGRKTSQTANEGAQ